MTRFLLIRHATTDAVGKHLSGRTAGVSLNEEGKFQAEKLAERLANIPIAAIYSSPLERAIETAEPLSRIHNLPIIKAYDFLEIDFGKWTNREFKDLEGEAEFKLFNSFRSSSRIPEGELMLEAQARIITGLEKLRMHQDKTVAIVSHSDLIKSAIAYYLGTHLDMFQRIEISPASVSIVELYDETARISLLNHTGDVEF